jgi:hypothetical protein
MIAASRSAIFATSALALAATFAPACSSKTSTPFASASDDASPGGGDDGGASSSGSGSGGGTSSGLALGDGGGSSGSGMGTGTCKDGTYTGTFMCSFQFTGDSGAPSGGADAGGLVITGSISFQLMQQTTTGESFMDTASGMFGGSCCAGSFTIGANVGGTLNCNSGNFTGMLTMGTYTPTGIWSVFIQPGTFSGPLTADYNGTTATFTNGQWLLTVPGAGTCPGTWTATYTEQ